MKGTIVSAADELYFPLLKGLVLSIHQVRPNRDLAICAINLGMNPQQLTELQSLGVQLMPGRWDFEFADQQKFPRWLQAMTARCHLPKYFPGFDRYIWLDADAWLQDWRAIDLLIAASADGSLAIVPEIDRAYPVLYRIGVDPRIHQIYAQSFGEEIAKTLSTRPMFNCGVFALHPDSAAWDLWAKWVAKALTGEVIKFVEQNGLNAAIYHEKIPFVALPGWCNWLCGQARPAYDPKTGLLVEPLIPHAPLSIIHVTPRQIVAADIQILGHSAVKAPLDYLFFQKFKQTLPKA